MVFAPAFWVFIAVLATAGVQARSGSATASHGQAARLEGGRIGRGISPDLRDSGRHDPKDWCSIKGKDKVRGENLEFFFSVGDGDIGITIFYFYRGNPLKFAWYVVFCVAAAPEMRLELRSLTDSEFPHVYHGNCHNYFNDIHAAWYAKYPTYRAEVDSASAERTSIVDATTLDSEALAGLNFINSITLMVLVSVVLTYLALLWTVVIEARSSGEGLHEFFGITWRKNPCNWRRIRMENPPDVRVRRRGAAAEWCSFKETIDGENFEVFILPPSLWNRLVYIYRGMPTTFAWEARQQEWELIHAYEGDCRLFLRNLQLS
ncbi:hypothetical protein FOZ62_025768, partial [Perkinsus olseni]